MTRRLLLIAATAAIAAGCSTTPTSTSETAAATTTAPALPTTTMLATTTSVAQTTTTIPQAAIDIRAALDGYVASLAAQDGSAALEYVDEETLDLFEDLLLLASAPVHVDEMDFVDAVLVMRLRHRFDAAELAELTPESVFVTAIEDGLLNSTPGTGITFETINIIDDEGTGVVGGSPVMWFKEEDDGWKVALGRTFDEYAQVLSVQMEQIARDAAGADASRSDALLTLLSIVEATDIDPALLTGPQN